MTTKASIIQPGEEPKVPYQAEIPVVEATPMGATSTQQTPSFSAALDTPLNDTPNKDPKTNTNKPNDGLTDMERFEKEQNRKTMIVVAIVCFFVILGAVIAALKSA